MDSHHRLDAIKTPKVERVLLRQFHHSREYVTGTLCLTDRHLIFLEPTGAQETWVLYHHISTTERQALTTRGYPLVIDTKTFQQLHLIIPRESDCLDIMATIKAFAQPEVYRDLYAFQFRPKEGEIVKQTSGWALFDSQSEYGRMGLPNQHWRPSTLNANYEVCETYSRHLYLPTAADKSVILGSAKFRSKGRLPTLSYYHEHKKSALCRSSQPLGGLRGRSPEDEQMLQAIIDVNPNSDFLYVVDTRPKINAMANKAAGKGYEDTVNYSNVKFLFYNIHNIHVMRESLQKMVEASISPTQTVSGFLSGLESSGWLKHIHLILEASIFTAKALHYEGVSVLVHCSDGWDRTAQVCALSSLLLDPYYRTLHGFMVLIEKEWLSFGHKLTIRSGHLAGEAREESPILTQFLECVWQVMVQFPTACQFNEQFLVTLHDHIYSCQFGTFLGNCEREREVHRFSEETYSFWGHVWAHLDDFINPLYHSSISPDGLLLPCTDIPQLSFWSGLYCRHPLRQHVYEFADEVLASLNQQNTCLVEHIKFLQQNIQTLKERMRVLKESSSHQTECSENGSSAKTHRPSCPHHEDDDQHTATPQTAAPPPTLNQAPPRPSLDGKSTLIQCDVASTGSTPVVVDGASSNLLEPQTPSTKHDANSAALLEAVPPHPVCNSLKEEDGKINLGRLTLREGESGSVSAGKEANSEADSSETEAPMSPTSYSLFKECLLHVPEMNLPWQSMRNVRQCKCGTSFSFSVRKFHCSYCGEVVCGSCCNKQAPLPWHFNPKPQRVCVTCFKLMSRRLQDEESQRTSAS